MRNKTGVPSETQIILYLLAIIFGTASIVAICIFLLLS
jgi:hypothetical protein